MKCILLYNIQRFKIQPLSAIFNTQIAITIIPSADNPTLKETKKIELGPMVIYELLFGYVISIYMEVCSLVHNKTSSYFQQQSFMKYNFLFEFFFFQF